MTLQTFAYLVVGAFVLTTCACAFAGAIRGSTDERRRQLALRLAVESHGPAAGAQSDRCFTARARHFEAYLKRGDTHG